MAQSRKLVRSIPPCFTHLFEERFMIRVKTCLTAGCVLALLATVGVRAEDKKPHSAIVPAMKNKDRHDKFLEIAKRGDVDVLFLGDSITDAWGGEGHGG